MTFAMMALVLTSCTRDPGGDDTGQVVDDSGTPPTDDSGTTPTDDTDTPKKKTCGIGLDSIFPEENDSDAFYQTTVEAVLDDVDATASLALEDDAGPIAGTSTVDEAMVVFVPDAPLEPLTDYTATLTWCDGSYAWDFSTDELGEPLDKGPASLVGRTYAVDLGSGRFVEPAGFGDLLKKGIEYAMLGHVTAADSKLLTMRMGVAQKSSDTQDTCIPTQEPTADFTSAPYFELGPTDVAFAVGDAKVEIKDMELSGAFSSDGSRLGGVTVGGQLDMRQIAPALIGIDGKTACAFGSTYGLECVKCSDGAETCIGMLVDSLDGTEVKGTVEEILELNCHEDCAASKKNKDCVL